ncbi:MAG: hypothetical protein U9R75_01820 [Candidatus Thermoplasmatota archaeon]|nr:hypothetical protein [Candidatus Thermoplasmatota archaeon]
MVDHKKKQTTETKLVAAVVALLAFAVIIVIVASRGGNDNNGGKVEEGPWGDLTILKTTLTGDPYLNYYEVDGANELEDVTNPEKSVYLLIGVQKEINSSELVTIGEYLDSGGHVIIADDGNLSERISNYTFGRTGGKVDLLGKRYLVDKLFSEPDGTDRGFEYNLSFIKGDTKEIEGRRFSTLVHAPNGMTFTGPGRPIMWTTKMLTVVDMNNNWSIDNDPPDMYLKFGDMGVEFNTGPGGGMITYISSSGLFTDNVFERFQNGDFVLSYIHSLIPDGGDVILDHSKQTTSYSPHTFIIPD